MGSTSILSIKAKAYEDLKISLAAAAPVYKGREQYLKGKHDFIVYTLRKALVNYGYISGVLGGDGEEFGQEYFQRQRIIRQK